MLLIKLSDDNYYNFAETLHTTIFDALKGTETNGVFILENNPKRFCNR